MKEELGSKVTEGQLKDNWPSNLVNMDKKEMTLIKIKRRK